jgi:N-acetylglucosamine repressor
VKFLPLNSAEKLDRVDMKRQLRRNRILHTILRQGPISKYDLSKVLRCTPPSVGETVDDLEHQGHVRRAGLGPSAGGRRPVLYELVPPSAHALGIDFGRSHTALILADLSTHVVARAEGPTLKDATTEELTRHVRDRVDDLLSQVPGSRETLRGIGLGVPGLIDEPRGLPLARDTRFRQLRHSIEDDLGVPTFLENDARTMALAELWFGKGHSRRDFIALNLGHGIGMGIIIAGQPLHGSLGHTGEIGHLRVAFPGEPCTCGSSGCLETVASGWALAKRAAEIARREPDSALARLAREWGEEPSARLVVEAAKRGDEQARALLAEAGVQIGRALAAAVNLLNPEVVIVGGRLSHAGALIFDPLERTLRESILPALRDETAIELSDLREEAGPLGASALVFQEIFEADASELRHFI